MNAFAGWHLLVLVLVVVVPIVVVGVVVAIALGLSRSSRSAREERIAQRAADLLRAQDPPRR